MSYTLFITAQQVIDLSLSERPNFKADKIRDAIILAAQEEWIRPVLGEAFYHHLQQELSKEKVSDSNSVLIEKFLRPCLAFYVKFLALPDLENPLTNKGSQELFGQSTKPVSKEDKAVKRKAAKQTADTLAGVLKRFIERNLAHFPLYSEENNVLNRVQIRGGVILKKKKRVTQPVLVIEEVPVDNNGNLLDQYLDQYITEEELEDVLEEWSEMWNNNNQQGIAFGDDNPLAFDD